MFSVVKRTVLLRNRHIYSGWCVFCRTFWAGERMEGRCDDITLVGRITLKKLPYMCIFSFICISRVLGFITTLADYPLLYPPVDPVVPILLFHRPWRYVTFSVALFCDCHGRCRIGTGVGPGWCDTGYPLIYIVASNSISSLCSLPPVSGDRMFINIAGSSSRAFWVADFGWVGGTDVKYSGKLRLCTSILVYVGGKEVVGIAQEPISLWQLHLAFNLFVWRYLYPIIISSGVESRPDFIIPPVVELKSISPYLRRRLPGA